MAELIKRLKRAIVETKVSYKHAWDKRQPIRNRAIIEARREHGPASEGEVRVSPNLTVPEANAFLQANENFLTAQQIYEQITNPEILKTLSKSEKKLLPRLLKEIELIDDKWQRGRAIPTMTNSGFRKAPPMNIVLEKARDVIELDEQSKAEDHSPEGKEYSPVDPVGEGSRRHTRRRKQHKKRRTQRKKHKKRRTQRKKHKASRGKTRRRRRR